jgi:hypothetical protein
LLQVQRKWSQFSGMLMISSYAAFLRALLLEETVTERYYREVPQFFSGDAHNSWINMFVFTTKCPSPSYCQSSETDAHNIHCLYTLQQEIPDCFQW